MEHPEDAPLDLRTRIEFARRVLDAGDAEVVAYLTGETAEDIRRTAGDSDGEI